MLTKTRAFIRGKNKVAQNEKWKKLLWVFVFIKYGKFWSISLELFIKHKPLLSEECICSSSVSQALMNNSFCCEFRIQWRRYIHTQYYTSDMGAFGNLSSCLHRLCHFFITQGSIAFMYELSSCWYVLTYTYYPIIFFFPSLYWTSSTGLKYTMKIVNLFNHREEVSTETKRPIYA